MRIDINDYIIVDSEICHGKPVFKGTRIMVYLVLEMLEEGASINDIFEAYPSLTKEHIKAALDLATKLTKRSFDTIAV
ncbi:DUF433 domain-containing protein [Candidatus Pacearchaeota archaeon]|nr:DUF433 domain-containing protein [Candidatus Pacearchaeota archaeon]